MIREPLPLSDYREAVQLMDRIARRARVLRPADRDGAPQWDNAVLGKRAVIIIAQADGYPIEAVDP
jgi:hypothetical protein